MEIAQAVIHHPLILFLGEPSVGLDTIASEGVWEYVKILVEKGTTVLMTTFYMEEADITYSRVAN